jgi:hypothetical protein
MPAIVTSREPANFETPCPKCHQVNRPRVAYVFRCNDERGPHYECDSC